MELNGFEKSPKPTIPKNLEDYLLFIAKTGNTVFPWPKIKPLMKMKLEVIITEFHESLPAEQSIPKMPNVDPFKYTEMKERIFEQLDSYSGVPFTVQRLCELLTQPKRHYKRVDKFMRGLEKVMLVVSTVDPLPVGGGGETMTSHNGDLGGASSRQDTHTGESPLKRMRLSTSEDEESGPCDSRDGIQGSVNSDSQDKVDSNEAGPSGCNLEPVAAPLATPENGVVEEMESDMDIDTECTSSEARLALPVPQTGEEEGSTWIGSKQVCDSGVVTTSEASDKIEGEAENEGVSDSTEGVKVVVEEDVDNCSSSDQDDIRVGGGGLDNQEEDSEAEPTEDSREVVDEVGGSIAEDSGVVSVQSSEERGEETDSSLSEPGGAADSSDDISLVPPVVDSQDQPSCSTAPVDNASDNINTEEETSGEVSSAAEANIVEDKKEENNVEVSPDQSDDTVQ